MKCENCKHWKEFSDSVGYCDKMEDKVEPAIESGWEGHYFNAFMTDSDFGCILFEEKKR